MIANNIKIKRIQNNFTQSDLAGVMPEGTRAMHVCYIEQGMVLPTKDGLKAICDALNCTPSDLYDESDIDLLGSEIVLDKGLLPALSQDYQVSQLESKVTTSRQHGEMVEFRTWLRPEEKKNLETSIEMLGYRSASEWFREAYRSLIARAYHLIKASIQNKKL